MRKSLKSHASYKGFSHYGYLTKLKKKKVCFLHALYIKAMLSGYFYSKSSIQILWSQPTVIIKYQKAMWKTFLPKNQNSDNETGPVILF